MNREKILVSGEQPKQGSEREIGQKILALQPETKPDLRAEMTFWSGEYNDTERQFARQLSNVNYQTLSDEDHQVYRRSLAQYENDAAYNWQRLSEATNNAMTSRLISSLYELADSQRLGVVEPEQTIEAATGVFYDERIQALRLALEGHGNPEESQQDQQIMRQTWSKVSDYIDAYLDFDLARENTIVYNEVRRDMHNRMIEQLNTLNDLAEKYHTPRFTLRNFMTNKFVYDSRRDPGRHLDHRAEYDRESVLAYFRVVFAKDFERSERKRERRGLL